MRIVTPLDAGARRASSDRGSRRPLGAIRRRVAAVSGVAVVVLLLCVAAMQLEAPGSPFIVDPARSSRWLPTPSVVLVVAALGAVCS